MKKYIIIVGTIFFIVSCGGNNGNNNSTNISKDFVMVQDRVYVIRKGNTIIKNTDNTIIKLYSIKNGDTTAILISGSAFIR